MADIVEKLREWEALRGDLKTIPRGLAGEAAAEIERLTKVVADCFRISGADGDEDWRLASDARAVKEVAELRKDYDEACAELSALRERLEEAEDALRNLHHYASDDFVDDPEETSVTLGYQCAFRAATAYLTKHAED